MRQKVESKRAVKTLGPNVSKSVAVEKMWGGDGSAHRKRRTNEPLKRPYERIFKRKTKKQSSLITNTKEDLERTGEEGASLTGGFGRVPKSNRKRTKHRRRQRDFGKRWDQPPGKKNSCKKVQGASDRATDAFTTAAEGSRVKGRP